jgi:hypothetical protein
MKRIVLAVSFFLLNSRALGSEIVESKICQKDMQVRMIVIKKDKNKFSTIFYKQSEELLSGKFLELDGAIQSLLNIEKSLTELGWNCKAVKAEYLFF